jgi:hypothetical protein
MFSLNSLESLDSVNHPHQEKDFMKVFFKRLVLFILFLSPAGAFPLGKNQDGNQEALPGEHVFFLKQEDVSQAAATISFDISRKGVEFKKEPDLGKGKLVRSVIPLDKKKNIVLPFVSNKTARTLYIDFNRNLDLTDDQNNVFKGEQVSRMVAFNRVRLNIPFGDKTITYTATINFPGWPARNTEELIIHTTWQGDIELEGKSWRLVMVDGLDGEIGAGSHDRYNFIPLSQEAATPDYEMLPFPKDYVFINNKAYRITSSFVQKDKAMEARVSLVEKDASLGELNLTGKYIRRLVLLESQDLYHVILENPQERINIPTGKYSHEKLSLWRDNPSSRVSYNLDNKIDVSSGTPAIFKAGGPLKNVVKTTRSGNRLTPSYELHDADDNKVEFEDINNDNPPDVVFYQNGQKIHSGRFAYG